MAEGKSSGSGLTIVLLVLCAAAAAGAYHHFIEVPNQKAKDKNPEKKDDKNPYTKTDKPEEKKSEGGGGSGGSGGGVSTQPSKPENIGISQATADKTEPVSNTATPTDNSGAAKINVREGLTTTTTATNKKIITQPIQKATSKISVGGVGKINVRRGDDGIVYEVLNPVSREFGVKIW